MINDELPVDPRQRYDMAGYYYNVMYQQKFGIPEFWRANDLKFNIEKHIIETGYIPDITEYCRAVMEAFEIYKRNQLEVYWKDDLDNLAGITKL